MIVDDNKKRNEIVTKLEEMSAVEQINEYGIMNNSILTANIVEARGLKRSNNGYKIFLTTENQKSYTEVSISQNGDPVWKEVAMFDIRTGREPLYIQIQDADGQVIFGPTEVQLDLLIDQ